MKLEVKVTMDVHVYGNKLMNIIETEPLCESLANITDMLTIIN